MSRSARLWHVRCWLVVGPVALLILAAALIAKPARPVESAAPNLPEPRP